MRRFGLIAAVMVALSACSDGDDASGDSRMRLAITDAPVDAAERVVVEFTGVELHRANGEDVTFDFDAPRQIDLLALSGNDSELLLDEVIVPPGRYEWIRLAVNADRQASDSFVELEDGSIHPLFIPSGNQSGLKLNRAFDVPVGGVADFTIDFDLRRSIRNPPGQDGTFILRPTLRLVDNVEIGRVRGTVAAARISDTCTPAVYVFAGAAVAPDDVDDAGVEPLTSALVALEGGSYVYRVGFLAPGQYTLAFTCDAAGDDPDDDDPVVFAEPSLAITITAGQTTVLDFP